MADPYVGQLESTTHENLDPNAATKTEFNALKTQVDNLPSSGSTGGATEDWVRSQNYINVDYFNSHLPDVSHFLTEGQAAATYATITYVDAQIAAIPNSPGNQNNYDSRIAALEAVIHSDVFTAFQEHVTLREDTDSGVTYTELNYTLGSNHGSTFAPDSNEPNRHLYALPVTKATDIKLGNTRRFIMKAAPDISDDGGYIFGAWITGHAAARPLVRRNAGNLEIYSNYEGNVTYHGDPVGNNIPAGQGYQLIPLYTELQGILFDGNVQSYTFTYNPRANPPRTATGDSFQIEFPGNTLANTAQFIIDLTIDDSVNYNAGGNGDLWYAVTDKNSNGPVKTITVQDGPSSWTFTLQWIANVGTVAGHILVRASLNLVPAGSQTEYAFTMHARGYGIVNQAYFFDFTPEQSGVNDELVEGDRPSVTYNLYLAGQMPPNGAVDNHEVYQTPAIPSRASRADGIVRWVTNDYRASAFIYHGGTNAHTGLQLETAYVISNEGTAQETVRLGFRVTLIPSEIGALTDFASYTNSHLAVAVQNMRTNVGIHGWRAVQPWAGSGSVFGVDLKQSATNQGQTREQVRIYHSFGYIDTLEQWDSMSDTGTRINEILESQALTEKVQVQDDASLDNIVIQTMQRNADAGRTYFGLTQNWSVDNAILDFDIFVQSKSSKWIKLADNETSISAADVLDRQELRIDFNAGSGRWTQATWDLTALDETGEKYAAVDSPNGVTVTKDSTGKITITPDTGVSTRNIRYR